MNRVVLYVLASVLLLSLISCIKEDLEECPVQFTVKVFVEDKQYINISDIPQLTKKDETLPFREFVGTLYYTLTNPVTGTTVLASSFTPVTDNAQSYTITLNDVPDGSYELIVWGNVTEQSLSESLHRSGAEDTDLYLGSRMLQINSSSQTTDLMMKRAKGNLVLLCNNFPSNITQMEQQVNSVYQSVDTHFLYSREGTVTKTSQVRPINQFFLAPTVAGKTSKANLRFYDPANPTGTGNLQLPEFDLTISRNRISLYSVDYKKDTNVWEIWTFVNGEWTLVHHLDI